MKAIYPPKLKKWDTIMVVAPARNATILSEETINRAIERLENLWLKVLLWKHIMENDEFWTSSIESRVADIHDAFKRPDVKGLFSVVGWWSTNQIIDYLDYDLIKNNPKIVCWFSDITVLHNAIFAKTWLITYYWPHFSTWWMKYWIEYITEYFQKCCMSDDSFEIQDSKEWSDDLWFLDQEKRTFKENEGSIVQQWGKSCKWKIYWGNLECLCVLTGTQYFPKADEDIVLFIEQDSEWNEVRFIRRLEQLCQSDLINHIKWLVIGKFQNENHISTERLKQIITKQKKLHDIPVISNVNFGHVMPIFTFPIGWECELSVDNNLIHLTILKH